MTSKKHPDPLIFILIGGAIFLCVAAGLLIRVLTLPPVEEDSLTGVTPSPTALPSSTPTESPPTVQPSPTSTPRPSATSTPTPAPTATPKPGKKGGKLALPTATPTPLPPTATPTATPVPHPVEGLRVGNIAPDFTVGSNQASRASLSSLRGKIVILNFWTTWCPHCRYEVPALQAIHDEYGPQGVVVLAINEGEKLEDVGRFANDNNIHFAVWLDEDKWAGNIYGVRAIPTTYFIDREGIIRAVHFGSMTREQFVAELKKLL